MAKIFVLALSAVLLLAFPLKAQTTKVFPFDYKIEELENGLKVVSVPLSNPNIISYYTIVRSGSPACGSLGAPPTAPP